MGKKTRTNSIFQNRILWLIVSLLAALVIWVIVTPQSAMETQTYDDVRVTFRGVQNGLVISSVSTPLVSLSLTGPHQDMIKLNASNLYVEVDVSGLSEPQTQLRLPAKPVYPPGVDSSKITVNAISPNGVGFNIERLVSKTVKVRGEFTGTFAPGFVQDGDIAFTPASIVITGPQNLLKDIDCAWVILSGDNIAGTQELDTAYVLRDAAGDDIDATTAISFDVSAVHAVLPVTAVKTVPLRVNVTPGGGATEADVKVDISPASIELAGDSGALEDIDSIVIGTVDLSTFAASDSETFDIPIPAGLKNFSQLETASVNVQIVDLATKTITVKDIAAVNTPPGLEAAVAGSVDVTVRGPQKALSGITAQDLRAAVDLSGYSGGPGTFSTPLSFGLTGQAGVVGTYVVSVTLSAAA